MRALILITSVMVGLISPLAHAEFTLFGGSAAKPAPSAAKQEEDAKAEKKTLTENRKKQKPKNSAETPQPVRLRLAPQQSSLTSPRYA
jgi:flagellar biosynthesis component FlhA